MELKDTVELMNSNDYKDRLKAEYYQTKIRYDKLHKMLIKNSAGTFTGQLTCPINILENQAYYMRDYLKMLEIRIEIEKIEL